MISKNIDFYEKEAWLNSYKQKISENYSNKEKSVILKRYEPILDYLMYADVDRAIQDINGIEKCLKKGVSLIIEPVELENKNLIDITIFAESNPIDLSDSMAILHSYGLRILLEKPKKTEIQDHVVWIHRYQAEFVEGQKIETNQTLCEAFEALYLKCWNNIYPVDDFNQLLITASLNAQKIQVFRAYAAYSKQLKSVYSPQYIGQALIKHPAICLTLSELFEQRFNPDLCISQYDEISKIFEKQLDKVSSLDHDTILRLIFEMMMATVRTNAYQKTPHNIISFKIQSNLISIMPKPAPAYEIFVYDCRFEGIHLRGGKVARGGLRWSNRPEDYRTEVLGLMKAQMIKNSVIVPTGSKGGFICKNMTDSTPRDQQFEEVTTCYKLYINQLLSITDNRVNNQTIHPKNTRIHDGEDPYLVVAADKGTATFSDTANEIAQQHEFWLDDAFASGGSVGYDHKKMGITARGAWESVKRHFRNLNIDCQNEDFSVIGIGDMSGDVFGNGMLLSKHIKLIIAFNHLHIFIDPNPKVVESYKERERLFNLPGSSWTDYDSKLISQGGGIFSRSDKKITLTPEIKLLINSSEDRLSPNRLIHELLKVNADLIWNGGIGTYFKAKSESDMDAQDKTNDALRVDATQLNVKVIGEGGNLGMTQAARIEYCLERDGNCYSDAIDNSAGVDCSDHEVNIKILLQSVVQDKLITPSERNQLLAEMTDEVAELTLQNNIKQTQIIDLVSEHSLELGYEHARFITHLEKEKVLTRKLEVLPRDKELRDRITSGKGLSKPEISTLLSYSKLVFKEALLEAPQFEGDVFEALLINYFPKPLQQKYTDQISSHALKLNIVATIISNQIVNHLGIGYGYKIKEETGANTVLIVNAYLCVLEIFNINKLWQAVESNAEISELDRYKYLQSMVELMQKSISWLLRRYPNGIDIKFIISRFKKPVSKLNVNIENIVSGEAKSNYKKIKKSLQKTCTDPYIIENLPAINGLLASFEISEIALTLKSDPSKCAKLFFSVTQALDLPWILDNISNLNRLNHWHLLAIASMRNEIHQYHREITFSLLKNISNKKYIHRALPEWQQSCDYALTRYYTKINEVKAARTLDFSILLVAVNEVRILYQQTQNIR